MVRPSIHIAVLLICAWNIYVYCQHETLLPLMAGGILAGSFFLRLGSMDRQFRFFGRIPLYAVLIFSFILGYLVRQGAPLPEEAVSPFPRLAASAQSATIIAAILLWLRPQTKNNLYLIAFMAWLTAAMSINVPYSQPLFLGISLFCLLSIVAVILDTAHRPADRRHLFAYYRDFIAYSVLLSGITVVLFFGLSRTMTFLDDAFMNAMKDYVLPRSYTHFLSINPKLRLTTPGESAWDRRPVLEVSMPGAPAMYLKTQIFQDYNNGVWEEARHPEMVSLPAIPFGGKTDVSLVMFTPLLDVVPAPAGVSGIQGAGRYQKDRNQIVYGKELRQMRALRMSIDRRRQPARLEPGEIEKYKQIPADIAGQLRTISTQIVGEEKDPAKQALAIAMFFKTEFKYSLNVGFKADNRGILDMIEKKRPAYCTYFATATVLLVRAQGIPARVATGFYTNELIDRRSNTFLGRVKNAHAWVEVLLTRTDPETGKNILRWSGFDPTPPSDFVGGGETAGGFDFERLSERLWLAFLRAAAALQNIDREKAKLYALYALIFLFMLTNIQRLRRGLTGLFSRRRKAVMVAKPPSALQLVYRTYERYLLQHFGETRKPAETDHDVVERLKKRPDNSGPELDALVRAEKFVRHYHAARFGEKKEEALEDILKE